LIFRRKKNISLLQTKKAQIVKIFLQFELFFYLNLFPFNFEFFNFIVVRLNTNVAKPKADIHFTIVSPVDTPFVDF